MHTAHTLGQFQAFLGIALELQNVAAGIGLAILQGIKQLFQFFDCAFGFGLRLGFAGGSCVLQFGAGFVQFFLRLAALLFEFGEQFFSISQGLRASVFQMLEQAARELLE
ncbi:hypothetical protein SRM1_05619 [Pseudomonas fluorescens]|nr:hypothetical protein SRM1_05619 [Pseudomonas fluorescens]